MVLLSWIYIAIYFSCLSAIIIIFVVIVYHTYLYGRQARTMKPMLRRIRDVFDLFWGNGGRNRTGRTTLTQSFGHVCKKCDQHLKNMHQPPERMNGQAMRGIPSEFGEPFMIFIADSILTLELRISY